MTTIKRFEDLIAWQKSRELTKGVYKELSNCQDRGFTDQIQRASVSIMSNIAEGFESGTKQSFLNYLYIAKGSAGEVRAQLYVALDVGYLNIETFKYLNNLAIECSKLIFSFIMKLKRSDVGGLQKKQEYTNKQIDQDRFFLGVNKKLAESDPKVHKQNYEEKKKRLQGKYGKDFERLFSNIDIMK